MDTFRSVCWVNQYVDVVYHVNCDVDPDLDPHPFGTMDPDPDPGV